MRGKFVRFSGRLFGFLDLLCIRHELVLLSTDQDLVHAAKHCSLNLWSSKAAKPRQ
jgi:hypothetical protein